MREQPDLLDHVADAPPQLDRVGVGDVLVVEEDPPAVGSISRLIIRSVVVLPQPDGPTSTHTSPSGTSSDELVDRDVAVGEPLGDGVEADHGCGAPDASAGFVGARMRGR